MGVSRCFYCFQFPADGRSIRPLKEQTVVFSSMCYPCARYYLEKLGYEPRHLELAKKHTKGIFGTVCISDEKITGKDGTELPVISPLAIPVFNWRLNILTQFIYFMRWCIFLCFVDKWKQD